MSKLIYFFSIRKFGSLTRVRSQRGTELKGSVQSFLKRSSIQNIESRPYHPQSQGKHDRSHGTWKNQKETWYVKWLTWYNSFINKLINHGCIDNKRNDKSITPKTTSTFANSIKHLLECKLWYLIHFLNDYRLISQLVEWNNLCDMPCYTSD